MRLFPDGDRVFEVISRYDDLLTMEGRQDYEPGDTLALIVPFLVLHGISEADIIALAARATLVAGADELVRWLNSSGWQVFCITTTYQQYAHHITKKLGIARKNVACTPFRLDKFRQLLCQEDIALLNDMEADILSFGSDDSLIKKKLDDYFWKKLPRTVLGKAIAVVKPTGGRRKVAALKVFCRRYDQPLSQWVVVGDSITDFRMLKEVDNTGGLAVAFNANQYALPYATISLASTSVIDLKPVLEVWREGGRDEVKSIVSARERNGCNEDRHCWHWLSKARDLYDVIALHRRIRQLVREEAGKLG
jgi:energy-converting hydrogenase A subunit R